MIRAGRREDSRQLAELAYEVLKDLYEVKVDDKSIEATKRKADLCYVIQQAEVPISYKHCTVFIEAQRIYGAVWTYEMEKAQNMMCNLERITLQKSLQVPRLRIEGEAKDYYIDTIVTLSEMRGKGVGSKLLDHVIKHHQVDSPIGLMVACDNTKAKVLYERKGFILVKKKQIYGSSYYYLRRGMSIVESSEEDKITK